MDKRNIYCNKANHTKKRNFQNAEFKPSMEVTTDRKNVFLGYSLDEKMPDHDRTGDNGIAWKTKTPRRI
jgi:hypothetical protein